MLSIQRAKVKNGSQWFNEEPRTNSATN
jgi:hypothetical protein